MSDERRDYAILVSLATWEEAEVMASALRADGIDAFIGNKHHLNVDWGYTLALGGVQVLVPRHRIDEAKDAIRARITAAAANPAGEPVGRRDRYKLWLIVAAGFTLPLLGLGVASSITLDEELRLRAHINQMLAWERQQAELDRLHCPEPDLQAMQWPGKGEVVCARRLPMVPQVEVYSLGD